MTEQEIRDRFFATRDAAAAIASRTSRVDELVRDHWAAMPRGFALAAVGGYGRGELFPHSDIDLLILTPTEESQKAIKEPLASFLRDLWDQGLRISQSVHLPVECNLIDSTNPELAVSLLDRRFLAGDESLVRQIRDPRPELGRNIVALTRERHARFQNTIYHLEPNVKEEPGGLRDLQVLRWLAKLTSAESEQAPGVALLFEIRCFLHYLAGRDDNKLSFERQDEIAAFRGMKPEELMRGYYRSVRQIAKLANRRLETFGAKRNTFFSSFLDRTSKLSNADFSIAQGEIFFRSPGSIETDPSILLRLFSFIATDGLPLSTDAEERVEEHLPIFRVWVERHRPVWSAFRIILRLPHALNALKAMHDTHMLPALFPPLAEIEALVIRDFYHRYTVDEHTMVAIETVLKLRDLKDDQFGDLANETEDIDLLVTALLFHDVGKAEPGESHTEVSRRIAEATLRPAGVKEQDLDTVCFLIAAHLELSAAMNGRDLSEPETIRDVATKMGTVERLKLLTLLTYGDISAVNPSAMTPWRRQLLWKIYTQTYAELTRELSSRSAIPPGEAGEQTRRFLTGLPPRYLRTHTGEEIEAHVRMAAEAEERGVAVSLVRPNVWQLTVMGKDKPFFFASVAAVLSSFGFNILKAEAFSNANSMVIDTFSFADPLHNLDLNPEEARHVTRTIVKTIDGEITVAQLLARRPRTRPSLLADARASFNNEASGSATLIELITQDRPGLLYDVASLISQRGGNIEVVLVDTEARKAIDVFYVTKAGAKLTDDEAHEMTSAVAQAARTDLVA